VDFNAHVLVLFVDFNAHVLRVYVRSESEFFAKLVVDALTSVKVMNEQKQPRYPIKAISILKAHGQSARESMLVNGFALNCTKAAQGTRVCELDLAPLRQLVQDVHR
jgi:T-complex protein 1 subunit alpha